MTEIEAKKFYNLARKAIKERDDRLCRDFWERLECEKGFVEQLRGALPFSKNRNVTWCRALEKLKEDLYDTYSSC